MGRIARTASIALACLPACAGWSLVEDPAIAAPDGSFGFEAPVGWMRARGGDAEVLLTREGPPVQWFEVRALPADEAFPLLGEGVPLDATPAEIAALTITELSAGLDPIPLAVLERGPAAVGADEGFLVHGRYADELGVSFDLLAAGFARRNRFYRLLFRAPTLHIFDRDRFAFDRAVATFRPREDPEGQ